MSSEVGQPITRSLILPERGEVDVLHEPAAVAAYIDGIDERIRLLYLEKRRVEEVVLGVMDAGTMGELAFPGGVIEKDPVDHGTRIWDDQILAKLWDKPFVPDDPELAEAYRKRLIEALRPEYIYKPLVVKLRQLAKERPDVAGVIADAEGSRPKPRHVHTKHR